MKSTRKKQLLALGLSGLLALGILGGGAAFAQQGTGDSPTAGATAPDYPRARAGLAAVVQASGLDRSVFADGLKAGKSVNQVLSDNGLDPATVQAGALAVIRGKLDAAVANGRITQAQADAAYARAGERLPQMMARVPGAGQGVRPILKIAKASVQEAARVIGIAPRDLAAELRSGKTVAQVATANGVDPATVVADLTTAANGKIDQAVTDGKLTADQGAKAKERAAAAIAKWVNEGRPGRGQ